MIKTAPIIAAIMAALPAPALAQECITAEIVLLADVSASMKDYEKKIQRDGYAAAFRDGLVLDAILGGYCGAVAVQYVEYGTFPRIVADWHVIASDEDAEAFSQSIETADPINAADIGTLTGMARAIRFAGKSLEDNGIDAERSVIDVSADGGDNVENVCLRNVMSLNVLEQERDRLTTPTAENGWREITINALPVIAGGDPPVGTCGMDLSDYMEKFVRGGPGSFVMPAKSIEALPLIVRDKIARESV